MRDVIWYSEAFKLRVVEDAAGGKNQSLEEARRRNGIRGAATLTKWMKKYGREDILPKRVKVGAMDEIDEMQAARTRIRELEAALANAHIDYCLESAFLGTACRKLGTTAEAETSRYALERKHRAEPADFEGKSRKRSLAH